MKTPTNVSESYNYLSSDYDFQSLREEIEMERRMAQKAQDIVPPFLSLGVGAIVLKVIVTFFV